MDFLHRGSLVVFVIIILDHCCSSMRYKRDNTDRFHIMLSLFKVKPLENSKVYKSLSNRLLLPQRDPIRSSDIKFNAREFNKYIKNKNHKQHDDINKDYPVITKELEEEPIKENIIDHKTEPRFEAVDKLEVFEDLSPAMKTFNAIKDLDRNDVIFRTLNEPNLKTQHLSDAEVFISDFSSRESSKRLLRSTQQKFNADGDETNEEYIHSSKEPLII